MVVSMVAGASSWRALRLAENYSPARNGICRCASALLDRGSFCSAIFYRTTTGLLFDEHVGRLRALGCGSLGAHAASPADRRRSDRRIRGSDTRCGCALPSAIVAECRRRLGRNRGPFYRLAHTDGHSHFAVARVSALRRKHWCRSRAFRRVGHLLCKTRTAKTCFDLTCALDGPDWISHDR